MLKSFDKVMKILKIIRLGVKIFWEKKKKKKKGRKKLVQAFSHINA